MLFPILAWKVNRTQQQQQTQYLMAHDLLLEEGVSTTVDGFNMAGFILQAVLQSVATFLLFAALDHERRFRSSGKSHAPYLVYIS